MIQDTPRAVDDVTRALPHAVGAEKSILSSMLQDPKEYIGLAIENGLGEAHFYLPGHAHLYRTIATMFERDEEIELVSLVQHLLDSGLLDRIGGPAAITDIYTYAPSPGHFVNHLVMVKNKATLRAVIQHGNESIADAYDSPDEPAAVIERAEARIMALRARLAVSKQQSIVEILSEVLDQIHDEITGAKNVCGLKTGLSGLDRYIGGLLPGKMYVVAARPSMGKTALMMNIVENICVDQGVPSAVFSLEMTTKQLFHRMIRARARVALNPGVPLDKESLLRIKNAMIAIKGAPFSIDDTAGLSIGELRSKARRIHREKGLGLIAIDYLQLMKSLSKQAKDSREREIAEISAGCKALAKELAVPVLILAQINRDVEKRTGKSLGVPRMSDLRESGAIEQDADMVGMLYRPGYYATDEEEKKKLEGIARLALAKNRDGETGEVPLSWTASHMRFGDATREEQSEFANYTPKEAKEKKGRGNFKQ